MKINPSQKFDWGSAQWNVEKNPPSEKKTHVEEDPYALDVTLEKTAQQPQQRGPDSHGCTINATCERCNQTDDCGVSHYCATNNRCGNSDNC